MFKISYISIFVCLTIPGQIMAAQEVYEYKDSKGVTEFTDKVNTDKELVKEMQIKKTTPEAEAEGKAQLDNIMEKDKELDERLDAQRKLENERMEQAKKQSGASKDNKEIDDSYYYDKRARREKIYESKPDPEPGTLSGNKAKSSSGGNKAKSSSGGNKASIKPASKATIGDGVRPKGRVISPSDRRRVRQLERSGDL